MLGVIPVGLARPAPGRGAQAEGTAMVTGAAGGIGGAVAKQLADAGMRVVPACRTQEQAAEAIASLGRERVVPLALPCDLASGESVDRYASALADALHGEPAVDIVVHAAGVVAMPGNLGQDAPFEPNFTVNHLGRHALTVAVQGLLRSQARVVALASTAALDVPGDFASSPSFDYGFRQRPRNNPRLAYCESMAATVLWCDALARRGTSAASVHPGPVATLGVRYENPKRYEQRKAMTPAQRDAQAARLGLRTPEEGARTPVWCATTDEAIRGGFFVDPGVRVADAFGREPQWRTPDAAERLWDFTERAVAGRVASV